MCELFALSSRLPTQVNFSLERLARRGGADGPHRDGWGVAYFDGEDAVVLREPSAASESTLVRFMEHNGPPSKAVISHIRLATQGDRALRNTQPFQRELGGRAHVFAHNGKLHDIEQQCTLETRRFSPIGDTDSEFAFCCLLERLADLWTGHDDDLPPLHARLEAIAEFAAWLRPFGPANFIYSDGDAVFIHAHRRTQADGEIRPPGMHILCRNCPIDRDALKAAGVAVDPQPQQLMIVASVPLTEENWEPLAEGTLIALKDGSIIARVNADSSGGL